jgi:hypothetical protein
MNEPAVKDEDVELAVVVKVVDAVPQLTYCALVCEMPLDAPSSSEAQANLLRRPSFRRKRL